MDFGFLFRPFEWADAALTSLLAHAPLAAVLALAAVLGLRHASDPDHLLAVSALLAAGDGNARAATRIGAWWGLGHATILLVLGVPLIALGSTVPQSLEQNAERLVGIVVLLLATRVLWRWRQTTLRPIRDAQHSSGTEPRTERVTDTSERMLRHALAVGMLHGLAGTGAVVLLLASSLPELEALLALGVFAPMSVLSMTLCTRGFSWVLTRRRIEPLFRLALMPMLAVFGIAFGGWYATLA